MKQGVIMARSKYTTVRLSDRQHAAVLNVSKRYKLSQYAATNRIFDVGLTVLLRSGGDLQSAQDSAVSGEIDLVIPAWVQDDISFMKRLTRRLLALQVELMWISKDHADKAAPGLSKESRMKAAKTFRELIEQIQKKED